MGASIQGSLNKQRLPPAKFSVYTYQLGAASLIFNCPSLQACISAENLAGHRASYASGGDISLVRPR